MVFIKFSSHPSGGNPLKTYTYKGKVYEMYAQLDTKERAMRLARRSKGGLKIIQTLVVEFGEFNVPGRYIVYLRNERRAK